MNTDTYKTKLEEEKVLLEKELKRVAVADEHAPGGFTAQEDDFSSEPVADNVDMGEEQASFTRNEAISSELEDRYQNILTALDKIGQGTYGICSVCEQAIEPARLDANPAASTCTLHMEN